MDYISKTQKKREAESLQELGEKLLKLSAEQIRSIELTDEIFDAIKFAKTVKSHGARRRQLQYIGTLMRKIDPEPIQDAIRNIEDGDYKKALAFKETERWRDELIAGNKSLMEEILEQCPNAERQQLTQLVRNAIRERGNNKPPKAFRALFQYLTKARNR